MALKRTRVAGGPGSGKTTNLLDRVDEALQRGIPPARIAFVTFTNAAADEARDRAVQKFNLPPEDFPHFRTLHSLCFRELGLRRSQVLNHDHLRELGELTGELYEGSEMDPTAPAQNSLASDPLLTVDHYARTTCQSLHDAWENHGRELDWFRLSRFARAHELFKTDNGLIDFTDMLSGYVQDGRPVDVDSAFVDEAQDLTPLQWLVVHRAFDAVPELTVAGDGNQSIHKWAGALGDDLSLADYVQEVLPVSHRLSQPVFELSQAIAGRMSRPSPTADRSSGRPGVVEWVTRPEELNLTSGTWLLLARTRYQLKALADEAHSQGVVYVVSGRNAVDRAHVRAIQAYEALRADRPVDFDDARLVFAAMGRAWPSVPEDSIYGARDLGLDVGAIWHDALVGISLDDREYYLSCLRHGEKLTAPPRVRIETIHSAKGLEAENVLLMTDLTYRTQRAYELDPDSEHRVFYVGVTRPRLALYLCTPRTQYSYPL